MTWGHRHFAFPDSLTPAQRRCIEAVRQHKTFKAAAHALGVSDRTVGMHLEKARLRAGVKTTEALIERLDATERSAA